MVAAAAERCGTRGAAARAKEASKTEMAQDPLKRISFLYHFTDRRNLPLIRDLGGLYPLAELVRKGVDVPAPGGNEWSRDADGMRGMDQYVHLCFRSTHPMAFIAR